MVRLLGFDGALKLKVSCLSPLARTVSVENGAKPSTDGVIVKIKVVSPLSGVAHTNSTIVPTLTFLG